MPADEFSNKLAPAVPHWLVEASFGLPAISIFLLRQLSVPIGRDLKRSQPARPGISNMARRLGREHAGRQAVFQIEHSHELGLLHQGQARALTSTRLSPQVVVLRKTGSGPRRSSRNHALLSSDYVTKERLGQLGRA